MTKNYVFAVAPSDAGMRLDQFLVSQISDLEPNLTRSQIKNLLTKNLVTVNGTIPKKAGLKLEPGQRVTVDIPPLEKLALSPIAMGLEILFEDEHLAVINKPAGISVHPSNTEASATLVHGLLSQLTSLSSVGGVERPGIVHRLDKGTSGVLVISKTDEAHLGLSKLFKSHSLTRKYLALCWNDLSKKADTGKVNSGTIETWYGRHAKDRKKMTGSLKNGRKAITAWKVLDVFSLQQSTQKRKISLVECTLFTGRTHQIRVHLSELGFPVLGDALYGNSAHLKDVKEPELKSALHALTHQMLHAAVLEFEHPVTKEHLKFKTTPPSDFMKILEMLKNGTV